MGALTMEVRDVNREITVVVCCCRVRSGIQKDLHSFQISMACRPM